MRARNSGRYLEMKYGKKGCGRYVVVVLTVDSKRKKLLRIDAHSEGDSRGKTPAEAAGLNLPLGENKLLDLIHLAKRIELTKT